ncbi:MAG: hypothetical protein JWO81_234 [Alphaproteobacteria bacterium]|nr:hypothetical protein [Alphaproteobacteria bacterium]
MVPPKRLMNMEKMVTRLLMMTIKWRPPVSRSVILS